MKYLFKKLKMKKRNIRKKLKKYIQNYKMKKKHEILKFRKKYIRIAAKRIKY